MRNTDPSLGRPLCPDCYDYQAAVVWNAHAPAARRSKILAKRSQLASDLGGRYWDRTSDLLGVNEALSR